MHTKKLHTLLCMVIAPIVTLSVVDRAKAHQPPDHHGKIIVEDIWVTPASEGGRSILRLRIINEGYDYAHLIGVETPVAKDAWIVGRIGDHKTMTFESTSVRADSELDLTRDHLWIVLGPLFRAVEPGESIPIDLVFVRSRLRAEAHVHGAGGYAPFDAGPAIVTAAGPPEPPVAPHSKATRYEPAMRACAGGCGRRPARPSARGALHQ